MFSARLRWNRIGSCWTMAICDRSEAWACCAMSWPSIRMRPPWMSCSRWISFTKVVLPEPESPTSPTCSHAWIVEADALEIDPAFADRDRRRTREIGDAEGLAADRHHLLHLVDRVLQVA